MMRKMKPLRRVISWSKYMVESGEEEWVADMGELYIGRRFASGRHSRIYRGKYKKKDVAIKIINHPQEDEQLASLLQHQFDSEVYFLSMLHHPNIITFVGAWKRAPVLCIITEYMGGGSLRRYLDGHEPCSVPIETVIRIGLDISKGMKYLHSQGIIHHDLKSENLLLGEDMCSVKVADFGISSSRCRPDKGAIGTYRWMAPELINGKKKHTNKVDVYSFGIILWELLTSRIPFSDMTPLQAAFAVSLKDERPCIPLRCPEVLRILITRCWSKNHKKRPCFDEIVRILESYCLTFLRKEDARSRELLSYEPELSITGRGWVPTTCASITHVL